MSMSVMPAAAMTPARPISELSDEELASATRQESNNIQPEINSGLALSLEEISNEREKAVVSLLEQALEESKESKSSKPEGMGEEVDKKV